MSWISHFSQTGRQEFFASPVERGTREPYFLKRLVQKVSDALVKAGAGNELTRRVDREQAVDACTGFAAEPGFDGIEQAIGDR